MSYCEESVVENRKKNGVVPSLVYKSLVAESQCTWTQGDQLKKDRGTEVSSRA